MLLKMIMNFDSEKTGIVTSEKLKNVLRIMGYNLSSTVRTSIKF